MGPKYPVIDPVPDLGKCMANFSFSDYLTWFGLTGVCVPLGYVAGKPFRVPSAWAFGLTGFLGGYMLAVQGSWGRLTGYLPNDAEVEAAGRTPAIVAASIRRNSGKWQR